MNGADGDEGHCEKQNVDLYIAKLKATGCP